MNDPIPELIIDDHGDRVIARIGGDVDQANAKTIKQTLIDSVQGRSLIIDLTEAEYLDSAGIAMLIAVGQRNDVALILPTRSIVRRALEIAGIDQLIPVAETLADPPDR
jgi:anti-anti-sigma factor